MNRLTLTEQILIGSMFAFGLAPAMAQHGDHGADHGDHQHAEKTSAPASLPKCPVMDEPINLAVSVATDDGPVFFCCKGCISKYKGKPAKYAAKVAAQRRALADRPKVQVTCPVSKEPVDQDVFVESNAPKVYLCCKGCVNKYQRNPGKYASALANSYTYQTKCPVMGEEIAPASFTTVADDTKIYFCCKGCDKKFFKDLHRYAPKLVAQGFTFNPKEMVGDTGTPAGHDHGSHDHGGHDHDH